jgi:periplasmic iron binding protein
MCGPCDGDRVGHRGIAHHVSAWGKVTMRIVVGIAGAMVLAIGHGAAAKEYFIGGQLHEHDMQIFANYLVGVEVALMVPNMPMGADVIHLEADIHATGYDVHDFPDGGWIPFLTVQYTLEKPGTGWKTTGELRPMIAKDGPHYGNNVKMNGSGDYRLIYRISPPGATVLLRHSDVVTGVPDWWKPFSVDFKFTYNPE